MARVVGIADIDVIHAPWDVVKYAVQWRHWLPDGQYHAALNGEQYVRRLAENGNRHAKTLLKLRSIASDAGLNYWVSILDRGELSPPRLRGIHVPERTGRWGMAEYPLQNIPKRGPRAAELRSGLLPPKGHILLRADWNAFEARLVAELSGDPTLRQAASSTDMHEELASLLEVTREEAKSLLYAILYGQTKVSFFCSNPNLSLERAFELYDAATSAFSVAMQFLDGVEARHKKGEWLKTPSGFRRLPDKSGQARNFVVQGFGADCLRWVLRRLDRGLVKHRGRIVNQSHDEVLVAVKEPVAEAVERLLRDTMEVALVRDSGFFRNGVPMKVSISQRSTW
jgi:DNA polymerase-1